MVEMRVGAAIVAAGAGSRFGKPKQFELLKGIPLFLWSVRTFVDSKLFDEVVLVVSSDKEEEARKLLSVAGLDHIVTIEGGATRQQSVQNALRYFDNEGQVTHVVVHDAARALVDQKTLSNVVRALENEEGVVVAVPVVDTLKRASSDRAMSTISRENLFRAQTPQGGLLELLLSASRAAEAEGYTATDESELLERIGVRPVIVMGAEKNFKITYPEDLVSAERLIDSGV